MHEQLDATGGASVLTSLRALLPRRPLLLAEALQVAELQATRLLKLQGVEDLPVPDEVITSLPRILVETDRSLPDSVSGCSDWDRLRRCWVILINPREPRTRQRLTMLHEYKHIIDHGSPGLLRPNLVNGMQMAPEEYVADYFAGCALMPRRTLKAAWANGAQSVGALAATFHVSTRAMQVRLKQVGLVTLDDGDAGSAAAVARQTPARFRGRYLRRSTWSCPSQHLGAAT